MPMKPPTFRPSHLPSPEQAEKFYEQQRRRAQPMRKAYYTARWKAIRSAILAQSPLCAECDRQGRVTAADTVDHVRPHRGNPDLFWDVNNLAPLCAICHSSVKQAQERAGGGGL